MTWVNPSPIGQLSRELDRAISVSESDDYISGVAWSLGVLRCTKFDEEIANSKQRLNPKPVVAKKKIVIKRKVS